VIKLSFLTTFKLIAGLGLITLVFSLFLVLIGLLLVKGLDEFHRDLSDMLK